jgi:hypothetical protein
VSSQESIRERPEGDRTGRSGAPDRRLVALQLLLGLAVIAFGWGTSLAGTEPFRGYWFDLVWTGFILAADAVVWSRAGHSLLHGGGLRLVAMFALSAPFWWAFEIANWRLENWTYVGTTVYGGQSHLLLKSLSFVFVLPALAESRDLLRSFVRFPHPPAIPLPPWTPTALIVFGLVCVPLLYLFPDQAYPLVWLAPLALLDAVAALRGRPSIIGLVRRGRAGPVLLMAIAGPAPGSSGRCGTSAPCPSGSTASPMSATCRCSRCRSSATSATCRSSWPPTPSGGCSPGGPAASPRARSPRWAGRPPPVPRV